MIFFIIAPLADVLTFIRGREDNWLVRVRDLVFASLAFPISVVSAWAVRSLSLSVIIFFIIIIIIIISFLDKADKFDKIYGTP